MIGVALLMTVAVGATAAGSEEAQPGPQQTTNIEAEEQPAPAIRRYLGTWMMTDTVGGRGGSRTSIIERYLLLKWQNGQLRAKTVDYLPDRNMWGRHSNWRGEVRIDRWNTKKQNFKPLDDGTVSVSYSGSNGFGGATRDFWWAVGTLTWHDEDGDGEFLRLVTTEGYAPSSRGNAWNPVDEVYRRTSAGIDAHIEKAGRR